MLTVLAAVVLATAPGALLSLGLPAGRDRWAAWAAAPALTLGLTGIAMGWLPRLGLPHGAGAVLVGEAALAAVVVLAARLRQRRRPARPWGPVRRRRPGTPDLVCLGVPVALALTLGVLLLGGFAAPPGWDAMNHALLTRNILQTGSAAVASACTSGYLHPVVSCAFYPLAADVSWAQAALLTGGPVSSAMAAWAVVVGPVQLVTAVYACVRVLGGRPVVAGAAAAATTLVGPLYAAMLTGRAPEQAGPGLSVAVALLVALAVRGRHPLRLGLLAGMGVAGIVLTHTYDVLFAAVLAAGLLMWVHGRLTARSAAWTLGAVAATTVVGPGAVRGHAARRRRRARGHPAADAGPARQGVDLLGDRPAALRPARLPRPGWQPRVLQMAPVQVAAVGGGHLPARLTPLPGAPPAAVGASVAAGVRRLDRHRHLDLGVGLDVVAAAVRALVRHPRARPHDGPARLRRPGRRRRLRARHGAAPAGRSRLLRRRPRARRRRAPPGSASPAGSAAAAGGRWSAGPALVAAVALLPHTRAPLRADLARRAPVGASYARTFAWLARSTPPGGVAAYDRHLEMMTWSWADDGVRPLFGIPPLREEDRADYEQRFRAWDWLVANPGAAPAGCLVRRLRRAVRRRGVGPGARLAGPLQPAGGWPPALGSTSCTATAASGSTRSTRPGEPARPGADPGSRARLDALP